MVVVVVVVIKRENLTAYKMSARIKYKLNSTFMCTYKF